MKSGKATTVLLIVTLLLMAAALLALLIFGLHTASGTRPKDGSGESSDPSAKPSAVYYQAQSKDGSAVTESGMETMLQIMRRRLDNAGHANAKVYLSGKNMLVVEFPDVDDPTEIAHDLIRASVLEFYINGQTTPALTGEDVDRATAGYNDQTASGEIEYVVNLKLTSEGAKKFADATKYCATNNKTLDIYVDSVRISSPTVDPKYASTGITGGEAQISGSFTAESATALANNIDAGALAYTLAVDNQMSVPASLGSNALRISLIAGAIGLLLVVLFMSAYYRIPGVWASIALVCYMAIFFLVLAIGQFNLTLTGIAGIVLSIGMAVDANVVIFERMKEELGAGKSVRSAIKSGYKRALWAILDANITTIIACAVLYFFGTGTIKGFATTLAIGVIISLFTALVITRVLLNLGVGMGISSTKAYKAGFGGKQDA